MIDIVKKYHLSNDRYQWMLKEEYLGKDKNGDTKQHIKETFHANISQVFNAILDRESKNCKTVEELKNLYEIGIEKLIEKIKVKLEVM